MVQDNKSKGKESKVERRKKIKRRRRKPDYRLFNKEYKETFPLITTWGFKLTRRFTF